jgi:hypothetical protein
MGFTPSNTFSAILTGQPGARYTILTSDNLASWTAVQTNTLVTNLLQFTVPGTNEQRFIRAQWVP